MEKSRQEQRRGTIRKFERGMSKAMAEWRYRSCTKGSKTGPEERREWRRVTCSKKHAQPVGMSQTTTEATRAIPVGARRFCRHRKYIKRVASPSWRTQSKRSVTTISCPPLPWQIELGFKKLRG
jgi:hypothetical protein